MNKILAEKHLSLLLVGFYYLVAFTLALFITVSLFNLSITNQNLIGLVTFLSELNKMGIAYSWWLILTWHISATIIILIFSMLHNNSSISDTKTSGVVVLSPITGTVLKVFVIFSVTISTENGFLLVHESGCDSR